MSKYSKTFAAIIIGVLGWVGVVIASPATHIDASEWYALATTVATAAGVYQFANKQ